jgi:molybdopterin biosynthesis enzyme MoaB
MEKKQHLNTPTLQHSNASIAVGIITISDRASGGEYEDLGGPALKKVAEKSAWQILGEAVVPDEEDRIQEAIRSFARSCAWRFRDLEK